MNRFKNSEHVSSMIQDYVLGLLVRDESDRVTRHIADCPECRQRVHAERQIGKIVQQTLTITTRPDQAALYRSIPKTPAGNSRIMNNVGWGRRIVYAGMLLLFIATVLSLEYGRVNNLWLGQPAATRVHSVAVTNTPTQTATSTAVNALWRGSPVLTASPTEPANHPVPEATPVPIATNWH